MTDFKFQHNRKDEDLKKCLPLLERDKKSLI